MTVNKKFWRLSSSDSLRGLAEWTEGENKIERVECPIDPNQRRGGKRINDISEIMLPHCDARSLL